MKQASCGHLMGVERDGEMLGQGHLSLYPVHCAQCSWPGPILVTEQKQRGQSCSPDLLLGEVPRGFAQSVPLTISMTPRANGIIVPISD